MIARLSVWRRVRRRGSLFAAIHVLACGFSFVTLSSGDRRANDPAFKVLAFYSTDVEPDHVKTAKDALALLSGLGGEKQLSYWIPPRTGRSSTKTI